jgi:hypothetical protein
MCRPICRLAALGCIALAAAAPIPAVSSSRSALPEFRAHEIATGLRGGYQVVVTDLDRDGSTGPHHGSHGGLRELVWLENPSWERHVLASELSVPINVAAADLDSNGIPELALAHGFATTPARSPGIVSLLDSRLNIHAGQR